MVFEEFYEQSKRELDRTSKRKFIQNGSKQISLFANLDKKVEQL